ncbi:Zn-dependent exopeptidase [Massarina eburnea CBS 473.64]|uniref:Peptide hydrolase n=1 Tax=Massarina eburnea CBS 473.64 TaxID=1395130 RepID=A0A6A6SBG1_9PLEO|nr:Zn-dependent exopeptidase [Massarina eburnea CBS 473.64]
MRESSILTASALVAVAAAQGYTGAPIVSSDELVKLVTIDELVAGSQDLYDIAMSNDGQRAFGEGGHNATVDYIYNALQETGYYDVYKQPFVELYRGFNIGFTAAGTKYKAAYMHYAPQGNLTEPLIMVPNFGCNSTDYPSAVTGNIAFIQRGNCYSSDKVANAKGAGAVGVVISNRIEDDDIMGGTLNSPIEWIPTVLIEYVTGQRIFAQLASGPVDAHISIKFIQENRTTFNVIAETKDGDHDNVFSLGGHTDSAPGGPGINDNGSGTIGLLTVAKHLARFTVTNAVRFGFWSAEEYGLLGSDHYVKTLNGTISGNASEIAKVRAYVNFDMIASPNYRLGVHDGDGSTFNFSGPPGSGIIEKNFGAFFKAKNLPFVSSEFNGRSDYAAFLENGIAAGGVDTGAEGLKTAEEQQLFGGQAGVAYDVSYHGPDDTMDNLARDAFLWNVQAMADAVGTYAVDFGDIPKADAGSAVQTGMEKRMWMRKFEGVREEMCRERRGFKLE